MALFFIPVNLQYSGEKVAACVKAIGKTHEILLKLCNMLHSVRVRISYFILFEQPAQIRIEVPLPCVPVSSYCSSLVQNLVW